MMRAAAALLVLFALIGCGGGAERAGTLGADAAELVPPDAIAFVSVDSTDREGWQTVRKLTGGIAVGTGKVHFALLDLGSGDPAVITLTRAGDNVEVRNFPTPVGRRRVTIEEIGDWSIAADSPAALAAVRAAQSGRSLADVRAFQVAMAELEDDGLAIAYATDASLRKLPAELRALLGSPRWLAARVGTEDDAVRLQVHAASPAPSVYRPRLLREVPSGAVLAVSFKDIELLPRGEGVLYVVPSTFIPIVVLTVDSPAPRAAARALERMGARFRARTEGALAMHVVTQGNRVTLTNGPSPPPTTGGRLVDDPPFKDALGAADVPDEVTWLAYADIQRLMPIVRTLSPESPKLDRVETLVAFGTRSGLEARITGR